MNEALREGRAVAGASGDDKGAPILPNSSRLCVGVSSSTDERRLLLDNVFSDTTVSLLILLSHTCSLSSTMNSATICRVSHNRCLVKKSTISLVYVFI